MYVHLITNTDRQRSTGRMELAVTRPLAHQPSFSSFSLSSVFTLPRTQKRRFSSTFDLPLASSYHTHRYLIYLSIYPSTFLSLLCRLPSHPPAIYPYHPYTTFQEPYNSLKCTLIDTRICLNIHSQLSIYLSIYIHLNLPQMTGALDWLSLSIYHP